MQKGTLRQKLIMHSIIIALFIVLRKHISFHHHHTCSLRHTWWRVLAILLSRYYWCAIYIDQNKLKKKNHSVSNHQFQFDSLLRLPISLVLMFMYVCFVLRALSATRFINGRYNRSNNFNLVHKRANIRLCVAENTNDRLYEYEISPQIRRVSRSNKTVEISNRWRKNELYGQCPLGICTACG